MAVITPTITAVNPHQYREQIERVQRFAPRLHVDLMDGIFTPNTGVDIAHVWLPEDITCDIHLMYQHPLEALHLLIPLRPSLVIVQAEAEYSAQEVSRQLRGAHIKFGVSLLASTAVEEHRDSLLLADHVLIFSGNLGHQGGSKADLGLLEKVEQIKQINPRAEIAWDGGVNEENVATIAKAGVDVINAGGFIHHDEQPERQYHLLEHLLA